MTLIHSILPLQDHFHSFTHITFKSSFTMQPSFIGFSVLPSSSYLMRYSASADFTFTSSQLFCSLPPHHFRGLFLNFVNIQSDCLSSGILLYALLFAIYYDTLLASQTTPIIVSSSCTSFIWPSFGFLSN